MEFWQQDLLALAASVESAEALFNHVVELATRLGFQYCAYGIQLAVPISRPRIAMFNNYAPEWQAQYQDRNYLQIDPTVQHALRSALPLVWSNDLFKSATEMWEEARGHGLNYGWAQSSRDPSGSVGLLTLARSNEPLSQSELLRNQAQMVWLSQCIHAAMTRILLPKMAPETQVEITKREKEVLRWTAEGKTAFEIAQILNLSERTVNFHVNNVVAKLHASNKTQAAVIAMALGFLF